MGTPGLIAMNKNNLTVLLTDLRALILKSRPAYRDFLGEVTETRTTKILENVVLAENQLMLPVADAAFSGFITGEAYRVVLNGEEESVVAKDFSGAVVLSNVEDSSNLPNDYWVLQYDSVKEKMIAGAIGAFLGATISVYYDGTVTTQKWSVKKLAYELLPDRLLSALSAAANTARKALTAANAAQSTANAAQSTADAAQSTANAAQSTANAAHTTADNAQTTANAALPKTGGTMSGNLTIDTENDSYQTIISPGKMALKYVRSADSVKDVLTISGLGTSRIVADENSSTGFKLSEDGLSLGCTSKDKDGIHLYHSNGSSVAGEIVIQHTNLNNYDKERISIASTGKITCNNRLKFDCGSEIEVVQTYGKAGGSAIILWSSTANSTKKFKITVDDTGTLSATEVTNTTT